jgi:hypothetical protein
MTKWLSRVPPIHRHLFEERFLGRHLYDVNLTKVSITTAEARRCYITTPTQAIVLEMLVEVVSTLLLVQPLRHRHLRLPCRRHRSPAPQWIRPACDDRLILAKGMAIMMSELMRPYDHGKHSSPLPIFVPHRTRRSVRIFNICSLLYILIHAGSQTFFPLPYLCTHMFAHIPDPWLKFPAGKSRFLERNRGFSSSGFFVSASLNLQFVFLGSYNSFFSHTRPDVVC